MKIVPDDLGMKIVLTQRNVEEIYKALQIIRDDLLIDTGEVKVLQKLNDRGDEFIFLAIEMGLE
jgi:hypothetical protein